MVSMGRLLIIIGLVIAMSGTLILLANRFFPWLGNLPGDVSYEGENFKLFIPITTMIFVSILATILLNIVIRIFHR